MDEDFLQWLAILFLALACIFNTMHCNYLRYTSTASAKKAGVRISLLKCSTGASRRLLYGFFIDWCNHLNFK